MRPDLVRRCLEGVASRQLPICPGDMLVFQASGQRMLVVCCSEQQTAMEGTGQRIAGIVSGTRSSWWDDFVIEWSGWNSAWAIIRPAV